MENDLSTNIQNFNAIQNSTLSSDNFADQITNPYVSNVDNSTLVANTQLNLAATQVDGHVQSNGVPNTHAGDPHLPHEEDGHEHEHEHGHDENHVDHEHGHEHEHEHEKGHGHESQHERDHDHAHVPTHTAHDPSDHEAHKLYKATDRYIRELTWRCIQEHPLRKKTPVELRAQIDNATYDIVVSEINKELSLYLYSADAIRAEVSKMFTRIRNRELKHRRNEIDQSYLSKLAGRLGLHTADDVQTQAILNALTSRLESRAAELSGAELVYVLLVLKSAEMDGEVKSAVDSLVDDLKISREAAFKRIKRARGRLMSDPQWAALLQPIQEIVYQRQGWANV